MSNTLRRIQKNIAKNSGYSRDRDPSSETFGMIVQKDDLAPPTPHYPYLHYPTKEKVS